MQVFSEAFQRNFVGETHSSKITEKRRDGAFFEVVQANRVDVLTLLLRISGTAKQMPNPNLR